MATPMDQWGKDHVSLLAYIEMLCVHGVGCIDRAKMRCNGARHPQWFSDDARCPRGNKDTSYHYPTRLKGYPKDGCWIEGHDDWDVLSDLCAFHMVEKAEKLPYVRMTKEGQKYLDDARNLSYVKN